MEQRKSKESTVQCNRHALVSSSFPDVLFLASAWFFHCFFIFSLSTLLRCGFSIAFFLSCSKSGLLHKDDEVARFPLKGLYHEQDTSRWKLHARHEQLCLTLSNYVVSVLFTKVWNLQAGHLVEDMMTFSLSKHMLEWTRAPFLCWNLE